jgi:hypothetical protein
MVLRKQLVGIYSRETASPSKAIGETFRKCTHTAHLSFARDKDITMTRTEAVTKNRYKEKTAGEWPAVFRHDQDGQGGKQ